MVNTDFNQTYWLKFSSYQNISTMYANNPGLTAGKIFKTFLILLVPATWFIYVEAKKQKAICIGRDRTSPLEVFYKKKE